MPLFTEIEQIVSPLLDNTDQYKCIIKELEGGDCKYTLTEYQDFLDRVNRLLAYLETEDLELFPHLQVKRYLFQMWKRALSTQLCMYDEYCNYASKLIQQLEVILPNYEQEINTGSLPY